MLDLVNANSLFRNKKYSESIDFYNKYLNELGEEKRERFSVYFNLSEALAKRGNYVAARVAYIQGLLYHGKNIHSFIKPHWWSCKTESINSETVVILIPVFEAEDTLEEVVHSLYAQEYSNILIVAVNDNSQDSSIHFLEKMGGERSNFHVVDNVVNNGPFISANIALACLEPENFGYFMKHDSDDILTPMRIIRQVKCLRNDKSKLFSTSGYSRIDKKSKEVVGGKKRGHNMTLYSKKVFDAIGYYDEVRFGADSEYLERALLKFGKASEAYIAERLTLAYLDSEKNIVSKNPLGSPSRVKYQSRFRSLHLKMKALNSWKYSQTFGKGLMLNEISKIGHEIVVCGIASLENRKKAIEDTLASLLPQVDIVIVYQNGYKDRSGVFSNPKVLVISSLDTGVDMGDAGKFYKLSSFSNVYYFSCDDDLIYPCNYVSEIKSFLKKYDNKIIASCHGRVMVKKPISYYRDKKKVYHFANHVSEEAPVHFGGTGVMAFHTSFVNFNFNFFRTPNMADVWVGLYAQENKIPIMILPHHENWIKHSDKFDVETTIFRSGKDKEGQQDLLISGMEFYQPLNATSIKKRKNDFKIVVGIPTYNRHDFLKNILQRIDKEAKGYNVEVVVNDDGSEPPVSLSPSFENIKVDLISSVNLGKKKYWETVNKIFNAMESKNADLYYYMADDLDIVDDFFDKSISSWMGIKDDKKLSLNLLNDGRDKCWTNYDRHMVCFNGFEVYQSQWLDMIMMFDHKLVKQRVDEIPLSRWKNRPNLSSGVGAQLSTKNHKAGFAMYQVKESLVRHGDHDSQMNFEERKLNPLLTK